MAASMIGAGPAQAALAVAPKTGLKGFGYGTADAAALSRLRSLRVQWNYNWSPKAQLQTTNFIPMIRDPKRLDSYFATLKAQQSITKTTHLLGFNEPDLASQANMTVDEVIALWPRLEATGLRLGSPSTISPNAAWMDEFMTKAKKKGLRIDFLTMHCYQHPVASTFFRKLDTFHTKWNLPVWVTEYAVADWNASATTPNKYSRAQVNDYMEETVLGMRQRPFVERFAWKTRKVGDYVMAPSVIFHTNGSLTGTGKLYASL